jgi:hypothetical protein
MGLGALARWNHHPVEREPRAPLLVPEMPTNCCSCSLLMEVPLGHTVMTPPSPGLPITTSALAGLGPIMVG